VQGTNSSIAHPVLPGSYAILVVGNLGVRRQTYRVLSLAGYRVFEAGSENEAIDVITGERGRLSLVIVDVALPAVNAKSFCEKAIRLDPSVRLLVVVPYDLPLDSDLLPSRNISRLDRPFTQEDLLKRTANMLQVLKCPGTQDIG
jgi:two-component system, cell cycle sensor histidine kinase and response regulator CckA